MGEWQGTEVEIDVTNVAHGGVAVARHDGRVVFVSDAIPGERVRARITDDSKKSFWRAETLSVVTASAHRRPHVWSAASIDRAPEDRAGGAEFGHIEIGHQRELKRLVLADSLKCMAGIESDVTVDALRGNADGTGWRTRLRLHVAEDGTPGPYAARSHRVIPVTDLPLSTAEAAAIAPLTEKFSGVDHVDVIVPSVGNAFVLTGVAPTPSRERTRGQKAERPKAQRIVERVGDREFRLDVHGFWQVHRHAAATLTAAVQDAVDEGLFDPRAANLDLYGGVGLLSAAVGDRFGNHLRITTVESDPLATDHAAQNLSEWVGAAAVTARVDNFLRQLRSTASAQERSRLAKATVVLDPPRAGAGAAVVNELLGFAPAQVVYVACDPVALARDVALFAAGGYELTRLRAFDLFPNTHHVEAVATLVRAG
jgi:tRNA/tmRNA/rRNA uracil-C5-methylase (TrmA/RlmC/RlmD family)